MTSRSRGGWFLASAALICLAVVILTVSLQWESAGRESAWTTTELQLIRGLWIGSVGPLPLNASNAVADDPRAAALGHRLFFDVRLSANGRVSCSTCHQPELFFTDGRMVSVGVGVTERNAMSVIGAAFSPWYFWNGRKDSLWSQALAPLESPVEHASSRMQIARLIAEDVEYRIDYDALFGALPDFSERSRFPDAAGPVSDPVRHAAWDTMSRQDQIAVTRVFVNVGKVLEAYQRLLLPGSSRFDDYAKSLLTDTPSEEILLSGSELAGLRLFIGEGQCINCHNGPLFSNNDFHNTAVLPAPGALPSKGRSEGLEVLANDPFNCLGAYSDAPEEGCAELRFVKSGDELVGAHRTPSLRNVAKTAPYMHAGQMPTLEAVLEQYNRAPEALVGHNDAKPLGLSDRELQSLNAFLRTLSGPISADPRWLLPPRHSSTEPGQPIEH